MINNYYYYICSSNRDDFQIMGPLLDPKIYPARVGASPETPTSRYDQPNAFLDKVICV